MVINMVSRSSSIINEFNLVEDVFLDIRLCRDGLRIEFEIATQCVEGRLCLWFNRGLEIEKLYIDNVKQRISHELSVDPDLKAIELKRLFIELEKGRYSIKGVLKGRIEPIMGLHGSIDKLHVLRPTTLYYPFTTSCKSILIPLLLCEHRDAEVLFHSDILHRFKCATSLYRVDSYWRASERVSPIEVVIGRFRISRFEDNFKVYVYSLHRKPLYSAKKIHDVLEKIDMAYRESFDVEIPIKEHHIVFLPQGGGFSSGTLTALDERFVKDEKGLIVNLVHEICHKWWFGTIKFCDRESMWLSEAIPEYITDYILHFLKLKPIEDSKNKRLTIARDIVVDSKYRPPTDVPIPLSDFEEKIWRIVGTAILYRVEDTVGKENMFELLSRYMKESIKSKTLYCLTWSKMRSDLIELSSDVEKVLSEYRV